MPRSFNKTRTVVDDLVLRSAYTGLSYPAVALELALSINASIVHGGAPTKLPKRSDIKTTVFWHSTKGAAAMLLIFPGGGGFVGGWIFDHLSYILHSFELTP